MIAYLRAVPDNLLQMVAAPVDGSGTGIALGPRGTVRTDGPTINNYVWSPDGTAILANYDADKGSPVASRWVCPDRARPR